MDTSEFAEVRSAAQLRQLDQQHVVAIGIYRAIARPSKGVQKRESIRDHAVVRLDDDTDVFLESLDARTSHRDKNEVRRFESKRVRVYGIAHAVMPSRGESLIAPCLSDIVAIREDE